MDSVDASGNAVGPATSFSASRVTELLSVLNLSNLVTGTVITYVELYCGTIISSQDFTLTTESPNLFITYKANPTFPVGPYRLQFYVNTGTNSAPAFNLDYTITA